MASIIETVKQFLLTHGHERRYLLAFSGGLDSHVLLHVCVQLQFEFSAVHIHHGLSPHANQWQAHCAKICADYAVPFHCENILPSAKNIEASARVARYAKMAALLNVNDMLL